MFLQNLYTYINTNIYQKKGKKDSGLFWRAEVQVVVNPQKKNGKILLSTKMPEAT